MIVPIPLPVALPSPPSAARRRLAADDDRLRAAADDDDADDGDLDADRFLDLTEPVEWLRRDGDRDSGVFLPADDLLATFFLLVVELTSLRAD